MGLQRIWRNLPLALARRVLPGAGLVALIALSAALVLTGGDERHLRAQETCGAPKAVCDAAASVFHVSAFERFASAVRIGDNELVTTRRAVADQDRVRIHLAGGEALEGAVVPSAFAGDLVLVRAALPPGPAIEIAPAIAAEFYVVGLDRATRRIEVFHKGSALVPLASRAVGVHLHHNAGARPGSGAAVVDRRGALIAIQIARNGKRAEAVPAHHIAALRASSGANQASASAAVGRAYRTCIAGTGQAARVGDIVPDNIAKEIVAACLESGARDLIERAGVTLAKSRKPDKAAALFARALEIDANAIDARIGRIVVLGIQQRHSEAASDIAWLLDTAPDQADVQRLALEAGKRAGDRALIERTLALIATHNPAGLPAAKRFVGSDRAPLPRL